MGVHCGQAKSANLKSFLRRKSGKCWKCCFHRLKDMQNTFARADFSWGRPQAVTVNVTWCDYWVTCLFWLSLKPLSPRVCISWEHSYYHYMYRCCKSKCVVWSIYWQMPLDIDILLNYLPTASGKSGFFHCSWNNPIMVHYSRNTPLHSPFHSAFYRHHAILPFLLIWTQNNPKSFRNERLPHEEEVSFLPTRPARVCIAQP